MDEILAKLEVIERNTLLAAKNVLTIEDVALLTGLSKSTLYRLTSSGKIPHYKPNGSYLYFDRKEIEDWQRRGRVATSDEIQAQATNFCVTHK